MSIVFIQFFIYESHYNKVHSIHINTPMQNATVSKAGNLDQLVFVVPHITKSMYISVTPIASNGTRKTRHCYMY